MKDSTTNPFGGYRWAEVDFGGDVLARLPVADLVQGALNALVEEADPRYGRRLFEELDRRGDEAWWEAVALCLDFLAGSPVSGAVGAQSAPELRRAASAQTSPVARLLLNLMADHRGEGVEAAASRWRGADAVVRAEVARTVIVTACGGAQSGTARLTREQMARLARELLLP